MYLKSLYPPLPPTPSECNYHNLCFNSQTTQADYTLHVDGVTGQSRTKSEFYERIRDGATALGAPTTEGGLGLNGQDDVVAIFSVNCLDYIALVHSLLIITTPFALISAYSTHHELVHSIGIVKPTVLFVHGSLLTAALRAAKELHIPESRIFLLEGTSPYPKLSFNDLVNSVQKRAIPRVAVRPATKDTLAYLVFSSGTTGLPKALMVSHGNLWFTIMSATVHVQEEMKGLPISRASQMVVLAALPFHHSYGLHMFCLRGFAFPSTFVVLPRWDDDLVLRSIPKFGITLFASVPSIVHRLVTNGKLERANLKTVDTVLCGAAHLPEELVQKISEIFRLQQPLNRGYGLSECTLTVCLRPRPGLFGMYPGRNTVGILTPGVEAKILRDDGRIATVNEPGELWVRGGNVVLGYYRNDRATKEAFVDGWVRTGDKFRVDEDGFFYFVDRVKDTLKISGVQVSPTEIEDLMRGHNANLISDVCVAGVSGGRTSDEKIPRAWIVLSEEGKKFGVDNTVSVLGQWVKHNLSSYKWLRGGFEIVNEIPKSPTGKVLRRILQDHYEQQIRRHQARL
ncbi:hypothetical protein C8Q75DRAFT_722835 [Abortiporus biennis]|nr:hypothetical protein C8Q75DRAFT_722835 [Abortiporus biennis]